MKSIAPVPGLAIDLASAARFCVPGGAAASGRPRAAPEGRLRRTARPMRTVTLIGLFDHYAAMLIFCS
jgi:hypothetical protein